MQDAVIYKSQAKHEKRTSDIHEAGYASLAASIIRQAYDDYINLYEAPVPKTISLAARYIKEKMALCNFFKEDGEICYLAGPSIPAILRDKLEESCPNWDDKTKGAQELYERNQIARILREKYPPSKKKAKAQ